MCLVRHSHFFSYCYFICYIIYFESEILILLFILADTCWALSYITDGSNDKIQAILEIGIIPKLVQLLTSQEETVLIPALRTVGNIVTGNDAQTDAVILAGGLTHLGTLLRYHRANIVKEAAWAISNIMAGNTNQIQSAISADLLPPLIEVLQFVSRFLHTQESANQTFVLNLIKNFINRCIHIFQGDFKAQKEVAWAITNLTTGGTIEHLTELVGVGALSPFCNLLETKDWNVILVVLDGLTNILHAAEKIGQVERCCIMIEEAGGLDKIEALQHHQNEQVYQKSMAILDTYFSQKVRTFVLCS